MSDDTQGDSTHEQAEEQVAATTDSYGGPVSEDELAEVYLPAGQDEVETDSSQATPPADESDDEDPTEKATQIIVG